MAKMIQVRNVPDHLHRELVRRARAAGMTLTQYIEDLLRREIARPSRQEVFDRIARSPRTDPGQPIADLIRQERQRRR